MLCVNELFLHTMKYSCVVKYNKSYKNVKNLYKNKKKRVVGGGVLKVICTAKFYQEQSVSTNV